VKGKNNNEYYCWYKCCQITSSEIISYAASCKFYWTD